LPDTWFAHVEMSPPGAGRAANLIGMPELMRRLAWPDCGNVRDVGGLPTAGGGQIHPGVLVRSDSLDLLTAEGVAALRAYGIRRVIDLRSADEARARPGPLAADPVYRLLPLIDPAAEARRDASREPRLADIYCASLTRNGSHIAAGLAAIADAPPGGVLVHCATGKDRTGMTVAIALRVAGATDEAIVADYAETADCLRHRFDAELAAVEHGHARERLRERQSSGPETMRALLHQLDREYGDAAGYLRAHGLARSQVRRLHDRLRFAQFPRDLVGGDVRWLPPRPR
jgi:protein tyrosine/serine phosphatase